MQDLLHLMSETVYHNYSCVHLCPLCIGEDEVVNSKTVTVRAIAMEVSGNFYTGFGSDSLSWLVEFIRKLLSLCIHVLHIQNTVLDLLVG